MNTTTTRVSRKNTPSVMDRKLRIKIINRDIAITISKDLRTTDVSVDGISPIKEEQSWQERDRTHRIWMKEQEVEE